MRSSSAVLVTGCSSGIGRAVAVRLHRAGHPVYATARQVGQLADLADAGLTTLPLDVTDHSSARAVVKRIEADHGYVHALVNNAGYGLSGTVEQTGLEEARRQFETNLFGPVALTQLVLPGMRSAGTGTIVTMSSIFGCFATAGGGSYAASKHALEAYSEALRHEVRPFGVRVVVLRPGPVRTPWSQRYVAGMADATGPYGDFAVRAAAYYSSVYDPRGRGLAARFTLTPDEVARAVERAIHRRRPRHRQPVGALAHTVLALRRGLPAKVFDAFARRQFPVP